jgi:hypothetical protein
MVAPWVVEMAVESAVWKGFVMVDLKGVSLVA